jgi:DNA-binding transcriptional regulator YiaG
LNSGIRKWHIWHLAPSRRAKAGTAWELLTSRRERATAKRKRHRAAERTFTTLPPWFGASIAHELPKVLHEEEWPEGNPLDAYGESYRRNSRRNKSRVRALELETARLNAMIARDIYTLRKKARLTQEQLAQLVGTTGSVISRLEDDDYEGHSLKML